MQDCPVCGHRFDPLGFQVVIPELGRGFDRIECAQSARVLATPGSRIAAATVVAPVALTAAAPAAALKRFSAPAAALGFLAAGTIAAGALWMQALATDTARFPFIRTDAPPATAGETMEARVLPGTTPSAVPDGGTANPRADVPGRIVIALPSSRGGAAAGPTTGREPSKSTRHPSSGGGRRQPQQGGKGKGEGKSQGKEHHGQGNGHVKHGDTRDNHSPGHRGGSSHGNGNGHGNGHGKDKKH